ncbi:3,4-dioxygenase subunit beta [Nocardioides sp. Soil797]|nr:3,4-dioxygenase subunit beta [Nocardioides sp. Soil797]
MRRTPSHHEDHGPTYEGRPLARPGDEIMDQGVGFDLTTLVTRRRVLSVVGVGVGAATLAACGADKETVSSNASSATSEGEIPEETNGPYPADGTSDDLNVLGESGIVRSDITSSLDGGETVDGVPLTMTFSVNDLAEDKVFTGAAVYAWHCDAQGRYSMYTEGVEDETWLRGVQVVDADGEVSFTTIVPGCYAGRWPHIHFEVYPDVDSATDVENVIATSQVAFPEETLTGVYELDTYAGSAQNLAGVGSVEDDGIFSDSVDLQMATVTGSLKKGYAASLAVGVDTSTEPSAGGAGGGMPGGEPPSGGTPPEPPAN